ncbi:hypothetical protein SAMN05444000_11137 [Shimia gijangensis]|uniref:DUF4177 domain-containing protein n=1 Tax=Shimia gijangensis TaxID=1470563 RepID=A0A1M6KZ87_9RHOB|nr:DUF4177 domain-containing protein [Shimia gijangensis]SHJ64278.1 hypothetical protein SAMN05444000_11137 [Shimia gijangensis]
MPIYEYKVVPAPAKGRKARGVKGTENRFAFALESVMNDMAADGWEFQRTETLPSEERSGLTSSTTIFRNVMVFRRARADDVSAFRPKLLERPAIEQPSQDEERTAEIATKAEDAAEIPKGFASESGESEPDDLPVALVARAKNAANPEETTPDEQTAKV